MDCELRTTVAVMIVALAVFSPVIFAASGPANTNYLALVMHIVPLPTTPAVATLIATVPPFVTPTPFPPFYSDCHGDPDQDPRDAPNTPVRITNINKVAETVTLKNMSTATIDMTGWHMCSLTGYQEHPIGGLLTPGASHTYSNTGGPIWNNTIPDPGALYNPNGQLVSYFNS